MEINQQKWVAGGIAVGILIISLFFMGTRFFFFVFGIGILVGVTPFVYLMIKQSKINSEKEEMFLEFARNLVESVKTGTSISKSIINLKNKSYGVLSEHIRKLINQISLGIPLNTALQTFSKDVNNKIIARSLTLIGQAERAGGDIGEILEAVAGAVSMTDKLKKERKAVISSLVAQGYIIFFVFIIIILVMQFYIIPMISGIADFGTVGGLDIGKNATVNQDEIATSFLYLLLIQGFFSGFVIGKLAEGNIKAGIKHSFALAFSAFLISTIANLFFGG